MNYEMIKCNIVVYYYGKILVNVAAYVIPGYMYVVYQSGENRNPAGYVCVVY